MTLAGQSGEKDEKALVCWPQLYFKIHPKTNISLRLCVIEYHISKTCLHLLLRTAARPAAKTEPGSSPKRAPSSVSINGIMILGNASMLVMLQLS